MFSPARFVRLAFSRFRPPKSTPRNVVRALSAAPRLCYNRRLSYYLAPAFGFSLFTWIGFDKETTPEDDLIMSIKHCILFIQRNEFDKAERLLHVTLRQAQQMFHEKAITYIYDVMANLALTRQELDKAKKLFVSVAQRLMQSGAKEDDLRIIHISLKLARISHLRKEYQTAQTGFEWCITKLKDKSTTEEGNKLMAMAEDWYGMLCIECDHMEKGLELLLSSHERTRTVIDFVDEHTVVQLNDIAAVLEQLNRIDESERYLKEAIEKGKNLSDMHDLGAIYVNLGRVYLKKGLVEEARKSCGYAWRLGYDRKNEEVKSQAKKCIDEVNKL